MRAPPRPDPQQFGDWVEVASRFAAGVVLHDLVLAPLVLLVGAGLARTLPVAARAEPVVGLVVLGSVTLLAVPVLVPVLGGFGVEADNPTLFDRSYLGGWVVLAGLVAAAVVTATVARSRPTAPTEGGPRGARPGR